MSRRSSSRRAAGRSRPSREGGMTLVEVIAALAITVLALASIHLTVGTAVLGKVLTSSAVVKRQQARQVVQWIADRVRQAGYLAATSPLPRCQDKIATQASYLPTASQLYINADVDNTGTPATHGFRLETVSGTPAITETVLACTVGATPTDEPVTSLTAVQAQALAFGYYDATGAAVTNLTSPAAIRTIRLVTVTVTLQASAGAEGPQTETWTTSIDLRNP